MNELLFFVEIIVFFGGILLVNKFLGKEGLFSWCVVATCLAEIQVCKSITLFGIDSTMGNVLFASNFLVSDILFENYGKKEAKKAPLFSLMGGLIFIAFAILTPLFTPNEFDFTQESIKTLFSLSVRVTSCSILMMLIANYLDVLIYEKLAEKMNGKFMFLRNNITTIICNGGENFLFTFLAFYGIYDVKTLISIAITTTIIEIVISLIDTPFLYLSKILNNKR